MSTKKQKRLTFQDLLNVMVYKFKLLIYNYIWGMSYEDV